MVAVTMDNKNEVLIYEDNRLKQGGNRYFKELL